MPQAEPTEQDDLKVSEVEVPAVPTGVRDIEMENPFPSLFQRLHLADQAFLSYKRSHFINHGAFSLITNLVVMAAALELMLDVDLPADSWIRQYVIWAANKKFEISKFKFKIFESSTFRTFSGSFSAVSKPNFPSKYSLESSRRDLHNVLLCTVL